MDDNQRPVSAAGGHPDPLEALVARAAEGLLENAASMDKLADNIRALGSGQRRTRLLTVIGVAILVVLGAIVVFYIIPISNAGNDQRRALVDCVTPSSPGHVHQCSDREARAGFNLIVASVRCSVNLPQPIHTADVRQCVADSLGVKLDPLPQANP